MARQKKTSIDYFPHTTEHGSTMFIIESRWGNDGYATWFKVLERIGSTDGMYLDCRNFAVWQCLVAYTRVSESVLTEILDTVAKIGKIDAELWQQKIIFCQKLVDGVVDAFRRRVESLPTREKVIKAANLDLAGNMTEDCPLNEHNDPNSGQNDARSTERERERERERESIKPTTTRAQEQLTAAVSENHDKLKILFPDINLPVATEKLLNHYRASPTILDPYATALKWFQSEFPQTGVNNGYRHSASTSQTGRKTGLIEANGAGTDFLS